jgi:hypothetical protein
MAKGDEMSLTHRFSRMAGFPLAATVMFATITMTAQTVISNETLVTTTFVINQKTATAKCKSTGCSARTSMFAPIPVTCPAATGQTCTFHISLDTKTSVVSGCGNCGGSGGIGFYQFLVDDAPPTIGPTNKNGDYLFERYAYTGGLPRGATRQSYPASVLTAVTNSSSNTHMILVNVGCSDANDTGGCSAIAYWTTMRVDVFEP